jgi:hypothetical protein
MEHDIPDFVEGLTNLILQVVGFIAAILFGAFSILSWQASIKALEQANSANLIAFLSLCADDKNNVSPSLPRVHSSHVLIPLFYQPNISNSCGKIYGESHKQLNMWANSVFKTDPQITLSNITNTYSQSTTTATSNSSKFPVAAAVAVSVLGFVFTVLASIANYQKFRRRRHHLKHLLHLTGKA